MRDLNQNSIKIALEKCILAALRSIWKVFIPGSVSHTNAQNNSVYAFLNYLDLDSARGSLKVSDENGGSHHEQRGSHILISDETSLIQNKPNPKATREDLTATCWPAQNKRSVSKNVEEAEKIKRGKTASGSIINIFMFFTNGKDYPMPLFSYENSPLPLTSWYWQRSSHSIQHYQWWFEQSREFQELV